MKHEITDEQKVFKFNIYIILFWASDIKPYYATLMLLLFLAKSVGVPSHSYGKRYCELGCTIIFSIPSGNPFFIFI